MNLVKYFADAIEEYGVIYKKLSAATTEAEIENSINLIIDYICKYSDIQYPVHEDYKKYINPKYNEMLMNYLDELKDSYNFNIINMYGIDVGLVLVVYEYELNLPRNIVEMKTG